MIFVWISNHICQDIESYLSGYCNGRAPPGVRPQYEVELYQPTAAICRAGAITPWHQIMVNKIPPKERT